MKVLIISHTALCTHNNMGKTLASLFSVFEKEELCQLYIYPMLPDVDRCSSHYRITDKDVLKGLLTFRVRGREITPSQIDTKKHALYENPRDRKLYRNRKNRTAFRLLLRDLMWKLSPWYSKKLESWIANQKPDCIFAAPGISGFLYDIVLKISENFDLPIVTYICDDFYFSAPGRGLTEKLQHRLLKRKTEQLLGKSSHLAVICEEIAQSYQTHFSVPVTTVMTGAACAVADRPCITASPHQMTYMGNLRNHRHLCLAEIGKALDMLNRERNTHYRLDIYTIEKDLQILSVFDGIEAVRLRGFVTGEDFDRAFRSAEILVHTEAFDEADMEMTRHSVSTKIADALASGIPLFAYGPSGIASMTHLIRNDCAAVVTEKEKLKETLANLLGNQTFRFLKAEKGLETARKFHSGNVQSEKLRQILQKANGCTADTLRVSPHSRKQ